MQLKARLARLAKAGPLPESGTGRAPEWFADKVIAFCHHLYTRAGLHPDNARLHPLERTNRTNLYYLLNEGFSRFFKAHGRMPTPTEFASWWLAGNRHESARKSLK